MKMLHFIYKRQDKYGQVYSFYERKCFNLKYTTKYIQPKKQGNALICTLPYHNILFLICLWTCRIFIICWVQFVEIRIFIESE